MRQWVLALLGLIIWAIHFLGVYAIASLADLVSRADDPAWRLVALSFSLICGLAALGATIAALRAMTQRDEPAKFMAHLAALGGVIAFVAIAWQTLPAVIGH